MPTIETIRRLTIEGQSRGMDKLVSDLQKAAGAQRDLAAASEVTATVTEQSKTRVLSASDAYERLQRRIDPVHKELRSVQTDLTALNNAFSQNIIGSDKYAESLGKIIRRTQDYRNEQAQLRDEQARINRAMEEYASRAEARARDQEAHEERLAQMRRQSQGDAFRAGVEARTGVSATPATSAGATISALQEEMARIEAVEKAAADRQKIIGRGVSEAFWQGFEERVGIGHKATDRGATFSALEEQAKASEAAVAADKELNKQRNELLQQIDPLGEATKRYNAQLIQNTILAGHGKITADQLAAANKRAADNLLLVQKGTGVAAQGFTNLGYQINDVISGLVMGQSVFTIAAQQGGQIAQALNGPAGVTGGLKAVGARALEMITPMRVLGVTLAGAAIEGAFAWNRLVDQQVRVQVALRTTLQYLGQTTDQFARMAEVAGRSGGLSGRTSVNAALDIAAGGRFDPQSIATMTNRLKDFAATIGEDASTAAAKFGQSMGSVNGIIDLNNTKIRFLSGSEITHIQNLFAQGRAADASAFALDKLVKVLIPAADVTGKAASAWQIAKNAIDDLDRSLGKYLATFGRYVAIGANDLRIGAGRGEITGQAKNPGEAIGEVAGTAGRFISRMFGREQGQSGDLIDVKKPVAVAITEDEQAKADAAMMRYEQYKQKLDETKKSLGEVDAEERKIAESRNYYSEQLRLQSLEYGVQEEQRRKLNNAAQLIRDMSAKDVEMLDREAKANGSVREAIDKVITAAESYNDVRGRRISDDDAVIRRAEIEEKLATRISEEEKLALTTEKARLDQMGVLQSRQAFDINIQKEANQLIVERKTGLEDEAHATERMSQQLLKYGDAKEIDTQIEQKRIQYRQMNMPLNAEEEAALRRVYTLSVQRNNVGQQLMRLYSESVQPHKDLNNVIEAAGILYQKGEINVRQYANAIEDARIKAAQAQQTFEGGLEAGLRRLGREWNDVSKQAENFVYTTGNNITSTFLDIADGTKSASDGFRDFAKSFLRMASEMIIKVGVLGPAMKALTNSFGGGGLLGLFGGGAATTSLNAGPVLGNVNWAMTPSLSFHGGGVVGRDGQMRYVHPAYFDDAPRLHSGTLRPDERAAILQTGEVVLSRQDTAMARSGAGQSEPQVVHLNVNVDGARGNSEIEEMVASGVRMGIAGYDKGLQKGGLARRMAAAQSRGQVRR